MPNPTAQVDGYIRKNKRWSEELSAIRKIVLECPLTEEVKWRVPCYTVDGRNIVFVGAFKEYCTLSFVKGVLLKDRKKLLQFIGENTQSAKLFRFTSVAEIEKLKPTLKAYILEAIAVEKSGAKVPMKKTSDFAVPEEFQTALDSSTALEEAFTALTPGRQRGYLLYFAGAKQSATRASRVEKHRQRILDGLGLDD